MNIRFFPEQFLEREQCFGLFKVGDDGVLDLPVTIEERGRNSFPHRSLCP